MMRAATVALGFVLLASPLARADAPAVPPTGAALQQRLAKFDPKAVAAARHYYEQPAVKASLVAVVSNIGKAMAQQVTARNPALNPKQLDLVIQATTGAMNDRLDLLIEMSMLNALEVFTTDQLVALDTFYSSPVGSEILKKMPQLSAAAPAMIRAIMPDYIADVRARLKAAGAEVKI